MKPWTETRLLSDEQFTADLWAAFWEVVGRRNASPFRGHPAGTVFLEGYSWERTDGGWQVVWKFGPFASAVPPELVEGCYPRAELLPWVEIGEVRAPVEPQLTT